MSRSQVVGIAPHETERALAALFFDFIVPVMGPRDCPSSVVLPGWEEYWKPEYLKDSFERAKRDLDMSKVDDIDDWAKEFIALSSNFYTAKCAEDLAAIGMRSAPIFMSTKSYDAYTNVRYGDSLEIEIQNFPIIDTSNMPWAQIVDIRGDPDFRKKARNFRLFLHSNYEGQEQNFILDDIERRLDEYEDIIAKHGVGLKLSMLKETLSSNSLVASASIATVSTLLGQPFIAGATVLAGSALEIGKLAITVAEKKAESTHAAKESEVSYLFELINR